MKCIICKETTLSGKYVFIKEQKRIICDHCQRKIDADKEKLKCRRNQQ
jgi:Zn finger protein HypA/HybF involved in hydrogenase expression